MTPTARSWVLTATIVDGAGEWRVVKVGRLGVEDTASSGPDPSVIAIDPQRTTCSSID